MKKIWKYSLLVAGALAAAVAAQQLGMEQSQGIFYRVSGGKNEMYLLGSIHVGSRDMYPMCDSIRNAMKKADVFVFECDTTSPEAKTATEQLMRSEKMLNELVSETCYQTVQAAADKLGLSMTSLNGLKPWAVTSTFTMAAAAEGMDAGSTRQASAMGVEDMVRRQANGKTMAYLETAEEQLGLMEAFSPALQEYLLDSACRAVLEPGNVSASEADLPMWPKWWREGNAQAFADSYQRSMEQEISPQLAQKYHRALVTGRNRSMAKKLQSMLESEEKHCYVATVGLMHLVLPSDSVVEELRAMGYRVDQILP